MRRIGRGACFETHPGRAGALLSMKEAFDRIKKIPHPEEAAEAAVSKDALR